MVADKVRKDRLLFESIRQPEPESKNRILQTEPDRDLRMKLQSAREANLGKIGNFSKGTAGNQNRTPKHEIDNVRQLFKNRTKPPE